VYYSRLRAAYAARDELKSDIMIIARTDARQTYGFDEAIERLQEAIRIGVDAVFPEALQSREEMEKACSIIKDVPVLLNVVPGGATPIYSVEEASKMGFRIIIYPGVCMGPLLYSVGQELQTLKTTGKTSDKNSGAVKSIFNLCGLQECIDIDKKAGGQAYESVGK
jgi:2-methylisocitrate lyase-like PEP mutase family enzyme